MLWFVGFGLWFEVLWVVVVFSCFICFLWFAVCRFVVWWPRFVVQGLVLLQEEQLFFCQRKDEAEL